MKKMRKTKMRSKKNARKTKRIRGGTKAEEEPSQAAGNLTPYQLGQFKRLRAYHKNIIDRTSARNRVEKGENTTKNAKLLMSPKLNLGYVVGSKRPNPKS